MDAKTEQKKCTVCSNVMPLDKFYVFIDRTRKSKTGVSTRCRECFCKAKKLVWDSKKGIPFDVPLSVYLNHIYLKAGYRKKVSFTREELYNLWTNQKGLCAFTGWEMTTRRNSGISKTNVSLDRIDSSLGYDLGNVQLVCAAANKAKWDLKEDEFIELCKAVLDKRGVDHGQ